MNKPQYRVIIDELVYKDDLPMIDKHWQAVILKAIQQKLTVDPVSYGEPLRKELSGYWKLRVANYRVIYRIRKHELIVSVVKIGARKGALVYREMTKRMRQLGL